MIRVHRSLRLSLYDYLWENGIEVNFHYIPVYRQPYYEDLGFVVGYCPVAERYFNEGISLPIHADLSRNDQSIVIAAIKNFFSNSPRSDFLDRN